MGLRTRLLVSLAVLFALGLGAFGWGTLQVFRRTELARLDRQLDAAVELAAVRVGDGSDGPGDGPLGGGSFRGREGRGPGGGRAGGPPVDLSPGTYVEVRGAGGAVESAVQFQDVGAQPDLGGVDGALDGPVTVAATSGDERWRVATAEVGDGRLLVVAVPTGGVSASVRQLLLIEGVAGVALLALLVGGGALLLRRGLRPLEDIADAAGSITAGGLDRRVPHSTAGDEVGELSTALNRMLDDLQVAFHDRELTEQRLRQFLADASHELRTPLTSIQGFAELLRLDAGQGRVDAGTAVRRIEQESQRMARLVEGLLALARLDRTEPLPTADVELVQLAVDACADAAAAAPDRSVRLDAPDRVVVRGSRDQLQQALGNLLANALRHTPAGTPVDVLVRQPAGHVELAVRDHGAGLDEAALAHAFDRFWQADRARVGTGAGLGLSITAAIAAGHGGDVTVGNGPDGGAVFTLRLPARPSPPASDEPPTT